MSGEYTGEIFRGKGWRCMDSLPQRWPRLQHGWILGGPVRITPYYTTLEIDEITGIYRHNGFVDIRNSGAAVIPVLEVIRLIGAFE